jgi:hypothetical protein
MVQNGAAFVPHPKNYGLWPLNNDHLSTTDVDDISPKLPLFLLIFLQVCEDWLTEEGEKIEAWLDEAVKTVGEITERTFKKKLAEKSLEKAKKSQQFLERIQGEICNIR